MRRRLAAPIALALCAGAAIIAVPQAASAQVVEAEEVPSSFVDTFEAGQACAFPLTIEGTDADLHARDFTNGAGEVTRTVTWGQGYTFTYTNEATGESVTRPSGFGVIDEIHNDDGSTTVRLVGNFLLSLSPADQPAGPSTKQYKGFAVLTVNEDGTAVLESAVGRATDICALLS